MFHCHFEDHLINGMFLIIEVGQRSEMKQPPPDFPRCHAYLPRIKNLDDYRPASGHCSGSPSDKKSCSCKSPGSETNDESSTCHYSNGSSGEKSRTGKSSESQTNEISYGKYESGRPDSEKISYGKYAPGSYMPK